MRLAHGSTGWALLTAGGLALSAAAQIHVPAPVEQTSATTAVEAIAGFDEIRVELAWLADNATFPCQLVARVCDGSLEICGTVPSEALRQEAVKIAKQQTRLKVVDKLLVRPGSALVPGKTTQDQLCRSATGALTPIF